MIVRSAFVVITTLVGMVTTTEAQAGIFGKRSCCQETPVVCPQSCCQQTTTAYVHQAPVVWNTSNLVMESQAGFGCGPQQASQSVSNQVCTPCYSNIVSYTTTVDASSFETTDSSIQLAPGERLATSTEMLGTVILELGQIREKLKAIQTGDKSPPPSLEAIDKKINELIELRKSASTETKATK
jgi:hypothetical protein